MTVVAKLQARPFARLHQPRPAPVAGGAGVFLFHENREGRPFRKAHMNAPHPVEFNEKQRTLAEGWELLAGDKV